MSNSRKFKLSSAVLNTYILLSIKTMNYIVPLFHKHYFITEKSPKSLYYVTYILTIINIFNIDIERTKS